MKKHVLKLSALLLLATMALQSCSLEYRERRRTENERRQHDHDHDHDGQYHSYRNN